MNQFEDVNLTEDPDLYKDTILIVDDVEENLILLKRILAKEGYRVETTVNSTEVLHLCKTLQPQLILLDIQMPEIDGFEVCAQLKKESLTSSIPVIFISAMESTVDRLRGFEAGGVDYIIKPIEIDETLARIKSHITIHRLQEQLKEVNNILDERVIELTNAQEQLHERESKLTAFINALPNITFVYDEEGRYIEIIGNESEHIVASVAEMLGKSIHDFLPPEVVKMILEAIQSVIHTGQTKVIEYQLPFRNGRTLWFEGRIALMEKHDSGKGKVICVTTEITERVELYQKVQTLAIQDPLTNCFNRRHFLALAENEIHRARRFNRSLSMMILDIDHFKKVNDQYGHPLGDQVLRQFVDICQQTVRKIDIVGRYGGEEFIILMPETDGKGALEVAERIRQKVENTGILTDKGSITITISGGLVCLESMGANIVSLDDFIEEADKALYQAKTDGRNRIHTNCLAYPVNLNLLDLKSVK